MLNIIILAAGQGTRMKSNLPKVLHSIGGRPMLSHVLEAVEALGESQVNIVIGHGANQIEEALDSSHSINFIEQQQQLGTGHAVQKVLPKLPAEGVVLILYGDVPLIQPQTLHQLVQKVNPNTLSLLTVNLEDPSGYGRIVRDNNGLVTAIVEQKDTSREQRKICEVNTGIMAVNSQHLRRWLPLLTNRNAQGEYYLTDIVAMAVAQGIAIETSQPTEKCEVLGVNNRSQQAQLERIYQLRFAERLMSEGVSLMDPQRFDCRGRLTCGQDVMIDVNCIFEGDNQLGDGVKIGPNCVLKNVRIANNTVIQANSVIEDTEIGCDCLIGPFARLRPGTQLADKVKIGNFVETKKATIGEDSKVNHLSYVGDAILGKSVNLGAGTITCNYDGANKHQTIISDEVFVGSNTALVAPVTLEEGATIGAGSTIIRKVQKNELSLTRSPQKTFPDWQRPKKKE